MEIAHAETQFLFCFTSCHTPEYGGKGSNQLPERWFTGNGKIQKGAKTGRQMSSFSALRGYRARGTCVRNGDNGSVDDDGDGDGDGEVRSQPVLTKREV